MTAKRKTKPMTAREGLWAEAAHFRDSLVPRADFMVGGEYPAWHGWALHEAFVAGAAYAARNLPAKASRIRAGEDYDAVLRDYGLTAQSATPAIASASTSTEPKERG